MTPEEWGPLAARIDYWWAQPGFTEERSTAYFEALHPYEFAVVEDAFGVLLQEGREFLPSLSVVLARIAGAADNDLRFDVMWAAVTAALGTPDPVRFLETEELLYVQFVKEQGVRELLMVEITSSYQMHALREAWKGLIAEAEAARRRARAAAGTRGLPLIEVPVRGHATGLQRMKVRAIEPPREDVG